MLGEVDEALVGRLLVALGLDRRDEVVAIEQRSGLGLVEELLSLGEQPLDPLALLGLGASPVSSKTSTRRSMWPAVSSTCSSKNSWTPSSSVWSVIRSYAEVSSCSAK